MVVSETKTVASQKLAPTALQQSEQVVPLHEEPEPTFSQMGKQNSILSLTLDEFQSKSGKSFGSMNMDEFLASIWTSSDNNNQINPPLPAHDIEVSQAQRKNVATEPHITQKKGTFSVPPPICKKTVDEVWSEIHKCQQPQQNEANNNNLGSRNETLKNKQTLGEMTLEDFLVKAGVVQESPLPIKSSTQPITSMPFHNQSGNAASSNSKPLINASYGLRPAMGMGFSTQGNIGNNVSSNGLATCQILAQNNSLAAKDRATAEKTRSLPESSGCGSNRKRIIDGPPEVVMERRQRRMLKNRESAARSRARRQVLCSSYSLLFVILQFDIMYAY